MKMLVCALFCAVALDAGQDISRKVDAIIDWQGLQINLKIEESLHGARLIESHEQLRSELRTALLEKLSRIVAELNQKSGGPESLDLAEFWAKLNVETFQVAGNVASATMTIGLRGTSSLVAALPCRYATETHPAGSYLDAPTEPIAYSGLVIDARHLEFAPTLSPNIYSTKGQLVYGAAFLSRETGVKRGVVGYAANESLAEARRRAGSRPYKLSALDISSDGGLVMSDEDTAKLTAHITSLKNLSRARVVILVGPQKIKQSF